MNTESGIQAILATCRDRGIRLNVVGDKLSVDTPEGAVSPDLMDGLRHHKACLLEMLQNVGGGPEEPSLFTEPSEAAIPDLHPDGDDVSDEECIEPPGPCPKCGSLMLWWDALGGRHCMMCDKPKFSIEKAAELRESAIQLRQFPNIASNVRRCC